VSPPSEYFYRCLLSFQVLEVLHKPASWRSPQEFCVGKFIHDIALVRFILHVIFASKPAFSLRMQSALSRKLRFSQSPSGAQQFPLMIVTPRHWASPFDSRGDPPLIGRNQALFWLILFTPACAPLCFNTARQSSTAVSYGIFLLELDTSFLYRLRNSFFLPPPFYFSLSPHPIPFSFSRHQRFTHFSWKKSISRSFRPFSPPNVPSQHFLLRGNTILPGPL